MDATFAFWMAIWSGFLGLLLFAFLVFIVWLDPEDDAWFANNDEGESLTTRAIASLRVRVRG